MTGRSISAGGGHTCARHSSGSLYCWGDNGNGELGVNDVADRHKPTKIG